MQNTKFVLSISGLVLLVGAAAFLGGRLWDQQDAIVGLASPFEGDFRSMIVPAPELPTSAPEVTGPFVARQDNTITVETKSLETSGLVGGSPADTKNRSGPQVEIVITGETLIYRETTQPAEPLTAETQSIQQTVEPATLDELDPRSMIMAWGRKSGDRIIAEVLMYTDLVAVKSAIFDDCEICP